MRVKRLSTILAAVTMWLMAAAQSPAEPLEASMGVKATATLAEPELLMGRLMPLTISVTLPSDTAKVAFPLIEEAQARKQKYVALLNDTIEILTKHTRTNGIDGNDRVVRYDLNVQAFDSGRYVLPPFDLLVDGKKVSTDPLSLSVIPVKVKADDKLDDFSDIAEPFEIMPDDVKDTLEREEAASRLVWWLIGAAVLLLGLIAFLYARFRKTGSILLRKPLPPYVQAINRLKKLEQQNLPEKGKTKEYYTRLTDIVRQYINRQFGIKTIETTTAEILEEVEGDSRTSPYAELLKGIFETSDFVKFAKVTPSEVENRKCMETALKFIEASHPAAEDEEGGKK